jgi:hypothetical protein
MADTMTLYQVISDPEIVPEFFEKTGRKLNVMCSFAYQKGIFSSLAKKYRHMIRSLVLDSGAYSVFTGKCRISLNEYGLFLKRYGDLFDHCFSLDDRFDDPEHNFTNQMILETVLDGKGWRPIPVVHDLDAFSEFENYVNLKHDYIALGSMGEKHRVPNDILGKIRTEYPDIKVHMFGTLNFEMLRKYRPASADASTWAQQAGKGGSIYYWRASENEGYDYNVGGKDSRISELKHIKKSPLYDEMTEFWRKQFGYTFDTIVSDSSARQIINLYYFTQM